MVGPCRRDAGPHHQQRARHQRNSGFFKADTDRVCRKRSGCRQCCSVVYRQCVDHHVFNVGHFLPGRRLDAQAHRHPPLYDRRVDRPGTVVCITFACRIGLACLFFEVPDGRVAGFRRCDAERDIDIKMVRTAKGNGVGILLTGTSIGGFIMPVVFAKIIAMYEWRAAMMIVSLFVWLIFFPAIVFFVREPEAQSEAVLPERTGD